MGPGKLEARELGYWLWVEPEGLTQIRPVPVLPTSQPKLSTAVSSEDTPAAICSPIPA